MLILIAALQIFKVPTSPDNSRKSEGDDKSPTLLLQSKPKECKLVISFEIKGKIHQWSFCREMSQNNLGDANGTFDCVTTSL